MARTSKRLWMFDDGDRELLIGATAEIPEFRAVVERAARRVELRNLWVVEASVAELDEMYSLIEAMIDGTRSRRRRDQLDDMRMTLGTAMDGF